MVQKENDINQTCCALHSAISPWLGNPISTSHSCTREHGNLERLFVAVGTISPILLSKTSEISSSASPARPRLESRMAIPSTVSAEGFGSGSGHFCSNNQ